MENIKPGVYIGKPGNLQTKLGLTKRLTAKADERARKFYIGSNIAQQIIEARRIQRRTYQNTDAYLSQQN